MIGRKGVTRDNVSPSLNALYWCVPNYLKELSGLVHPDNAILREQPDWGVILPHLPASQFVYILYYLIGVVIVRRLCKESYETIRKAAVHEQNIVYLMDILKLGPVRESILKPHKTIICGLLCSGGIASLQLTPNITEVMVTETPQSVWEQLCEVYCYIVRFSIQLEVLFLIPVIRKIHKANSPVSLAAEQDIRRPVKDPGFKMHIRNNYYSHFTLRSSVNTT